MEQFTNRIPDHQLAGCALSSLHSGPELEVTSWHPKHQLRKLQPDRWCGLGVRLFWCHDNSPHLASMTALYYCPTVITAVIGSVKLQWLYWSVASVPSKIGGDTCWLVSTKLLNGSNSISWKFFPSFPIETSIIRGHMIVLCLNRGNAIFTFYIWNATIIQTAHSELYTYVLFIFIHGAVYYEWKWSV